MQDITELERRIAAAFDRIDRGLSALSRKSSAATGGAMAGDTPDFALAAGVPQMAGVLRALESAKASAADWAERYRLLEQQMRAETMSMATDIANLTESLNNARAAAASPASSPDRPPPTGDAAQIDARIDALMARVATQDSELARMHAQRADEAAELGALIAAIEPLVAEVSDV